MAEVRLIEVREELLAENRQQAGDILSLMFPVAFGTHQPDEPLFFHGIEH